MTAAETPKQADAYFAERERRIATEMTPAHRQALTVALAAYDHPFRPDYLVSARTVLDGFCIDVASHIWLVAQGLAVSVYYGRASLTRTGVELARREATR